MINIHIYFVKESTSVFTTEHRDMNFVFWLTSQPCIRRVCSELTEMSGLWRRWNSVWKEGRTWTFSPNVTHAPWAVCSNSISETYQRVWWTQGFRRPWYSTTKVDKTLILTLLLLLLSDTNCVANNPNITCFVCRVRWWWFLGRFQRPPPGAPRCSPQPPPLPLPLPHPGGESPQGQPHDGPQPRHGLRTHCVSVSVTLSY